MTQAAGVGLSVSYEGAEDVWLRMDAGQDTQHLILGLERIFNVPPVRGHPFRLWRREGGEWVAVGGAQPDTHAPIGKSLEPGEMYAVTLAREKPVITRGRRP